MYLGHKAVTNESVDGVGFLKLKSNHLKIISIAKQIKLYPKFAKFVHKRTIRRLTVSAGLFGKIGIGQEVTANK